MPNYVKKKKKEKKKDVADNWLEYLTETTAELSSPHTSSIHSFY